jgi:hypothetical protein
LRLAAAIGLLAEWLAPMIVVYRLVGLMSIARENVTYGAVVSSVHASPM